MGLRIQHGTADFNSIELRSVSNGVAVFIDNEMVASFDDTGEFQFYGKSNEVKYRGRWSR